MKSRFPNSAAECKACLRPGGRPNRAAGSLDQTPAGRLREIRPLVVQQESRCWYHAGDSGSGFPVSTGCLAGIRAGTAPCDAGAGQEPERLAESTWTGILGMGNIGGRTADEALQQLEEMTAGVAAVPVEEFRERTRRAQAWMLANGCAALYVHAGTNLYYFTGLEWSPSERMVAGLIPATGDPWYICPRFEIDTLQDYWQIPGEIVTWEEHERPGRLLAGSLADRGIREGRLLVDPVTPYFILDAMRSDLPPAIGFEIATPLVDLTRGRKTAVELALIQRSHEITAQVIAAAASILRPGISTTEVARFINQAHRRTAGVDSWFVIVLFGVATSYPHGVKDPQILREGDWVLIDTGFRLHGYHSDITRTFVFGRPDADQQRAWEVERDAQLAGFAAARIGVPCSAVDEAARRSLQAAGYGPDYRLPGLPHRTGHGCGLDIHESPNLVRGNDQPLEPGMVFSCEPTLIVPGRFGVRLEDHFYMTAEGPRWFTRPAPSMDVLFAK